MAKHWSYTDLTARDAVTLTVTDPATGADTVYEVSQFVGSWAVNEIPSAQCALAVGRRPAFAAQAGRAAVHGHAAYRHMAPAVVHFRPAREVRPDGTAWPAGRRVLFRGYLLGLAPRKLQGKFTVVAALTHWLADLACSSCLTQNGHPSNPSNLNAAAVLGHSATSTVALGAYVSSLWAGGLPALSANRLSEDLWRALKAVLVRLASTPTMPAGGPAACAGNGLYAPNSRALAALARIEGPVDAATAADAAAAALVGLAALGPLGAAALALLAPQAGVNVDAPYVWGRPLGLDTLAASDVERGISNAIGEELVVNYASTTFWDKLVGQLLPQYGMALVPRVESALVIADTPCVRDLVWKDVRPEDYDDTGHSGALNRPLRAVGVLSDWTSQAFVGPQRGGYPLVGGCWVEDSVSEADGLVRYVPEPSWLSQAAVLARQGQSNNNLVAVAAGVPAPTVTTGAGAVVPTASALVDSVLTGLYQRYAHAVYLNEVLRGRGGVLGGYLRFDIAPGSNLRILPATEVFLGGDDDLAVNLYANVARVTVRIDCEQPSAGTSFQLTHVRTEAENGVTATSTDRHPLFDEHSIHGSRGVDPGEHGAPLIDDYNFPD